MSKSSGSFQLRPLLPPSFFRRIQDIRQGMIATVLETRGHTYKKPGEKAIFTAGSLFPEFGNLGAGCLDRQILQHGKTVINREIPKIFSVETDSPEDIHFGTGSYCGGEVTLLLEPLLSSQKKTYTQLENQLASSESVTLFHNLKTGALSLGDSFRSDENESVLEERYQPPASLVLFGATPLTVELIHSLRKLPFRISVADWREAYIEVLEQNISSSLCTINTKKNELPLKNTQFLLLQSHHYEKERDLLQTAIQTGVFYIGMLSSEQRKENMFQDLIDRNITRETLQEHVSSPVGMPINARSDPEIAVSIVGELIQEFRKYRSPETK